MKLSERTFHRLFSINLYKNRRLMLGEMSFSKDFTRETRGDPYPVLSRAEGVRETVEDARYLVESEEGGVARLLGGHFPFASYEARILALRGRTGFVFRAEEKRSRRSRHVSAPGCLFSFPPGETGRTSIFRREKSHAFA